MGCTVAGVLVQVQLAWAQALCRQAWALGGHSLAWVQSKMVWVVGACMQASLVLGLCRQALVLAPCMLAPYMLAWLGQAPCKLA